MNIILEEQIKETIAIAETCPEPYRIECFKILLNYQLERNTKKGYNNVHDFPPESNDKGEEKKQREILDTDIHIKFKQFMKKYSVDLEMINQIFYFEENNFFGMYDDLKTIKATIVQIRIALLQAMTNAMANGEFEFDGEAVRAECQKRKSYDPDKFSTHFNRNANLFEGFTAYKKGGIIKLSEIGKEELSNVIKEISK